MSIVTKLAAASVLALSIAAPVFAAEETTLLERGTPTVSTGVDAMAYAPAPAATSATNTVGRDFSIRSQR
jgi:hypothetical protein